MPVPHRIARHGIPVDFRLILYRLHGDLDHAAEQVQVAIKQAKSMLELRKKQWLAQRQKVKAVEHLKEQQLKKVALLAEKREQKMFDEIATQQFIRRNY